ncbi:MAG: HAMP domain-containing protein [Nanoarchaeota archaeon]|nr:HAMP domain-containing protein [Nanoarchaeota archaeon]
MRIKLSSILFKILFFGVILIFISLFTFSFFLVKTEQNRLSEDILWDGLVFAEFTAQSIYEDYWLYYTHPTEGFFERFMERVNYKLVKNRDVVRVSLIGVNGKILFDSDEFEKCKYNGSRVRFIEDSITLDLIKKENLSYREIKLNDEDAVEVVVPIREVSGGHVMSMRYIISYHSFREKINAVYSQIIFITIFLSILSFALLIPFSISLTRPIIKLKELTKRIGAGDLDIKIDLKAHDEISELADAFNQMTSNLKRSRADLKGYNMELGRKVKERTKELEDKNRELEKFNKLAVGRELKMIELKKKIKELEEKVKGK